MGREFLCLGRREEFGERKSRDSEVAGIDCIYRFVLANGIHVDDVLH
jgi:hypothetical protein